ncbi:MAG: hypothetical protein AAF614_23980 [Chloroflexota bacterium]
MFASRWHVPKQQLLQTAVLTLTLLLILTILVIQLGIFDPKPIGSLRHTVGSTLLTVPKQSEKITWLETPTLPENFSVRLTAVFQSGDPDSGYGLLLGSPDHHLAIAVSPLGLVSIWESNLPRPLLQGRGQEAFLQLGKTEGRLPWQPWPHIAPTHTPNEIWLDVHADQLTVRLNRERLWAAEWAGAKEQIGLVGISFGETAVIKFQQLDLLWE